MGCCFALKKKKKIKNHKGFPHLHGTLKSRISKLPLSQAEDYY